MGISTSFQYGAGRLKGDLSIFTEEDFWNVSDKMLELCGYRPEFIAVIDDMNEHTAIKTVELAKKMDVVCKINYAMASGEQGYTYRLSKIYKLYLDIYNAGLGDWEYNVQQMIRRLASDTTTCPQNRMCDSGIRAFNPGGDYYSCGSLGDDKDYPIDFEYEMSGGFETPLQHDPEIQTMKMACYTCPMFKICNGCRKTVRDHKREGQVEDHCFEMKQLAPDILKLNGKDPSEVTPYVREYD